MTDHGELIPLERSVDPIPVDGRDPIARMSTPELVLEAVKVVPNMLKLLYRLLRDPRVPRRRKMVVGAAALYLASPIDLVPDLLLPLIGQVDDLLLAVFAIHHLLAGVEPEVLEEYWDGHGDTLELARAFAAWAAEFMPSSISRWLER